MDILFQLLKLSAEMNGAGSLECAKIT